MTNIFSAPDLCSFNSISSGAWPCDKNDRPLRFHPDVIYTVLPPISDVLKNKDLLATAFIEFSRGLHLLWINEYKEIDHPIEKLRQYIQLIFSVYGKDEMYWAINVACLGAKSTERLIDLAADGIGDWSA